MSTSSNSFRIVISEASLFKAKAAPKSNYFCGHLCDETDLETYEAEFSTTATKDFSGNRHEKDSLSLSCQDCTLKDTLKNSEIGLQFGVFSGVSSPKFTFENTLELPLSHKLAVSAGTSGTSSEILFDSSLFTVNFLLDKFQSARASGAVLTHRSHMPSQEP